MEVVFGFVADHRSALFATLTQIAHLEVAFMPMLFSRSLDILLFLRFEK